MDCIVHGVAKSRTRLNNFHFLPLYFPFHAFSFFPLSSFSLPSSPLSSFSLILFSTLDHSHFFALALKVIPPLSFSPGDQKSA